MSTRLGKLAGLKPPPAPVESNGTAVPASPSGGSVSSSPFLKLLKILRHQVPEHLQRVCVVSINTNPILDGAAKPAASSFGLGGKKMPNFKAITAAPPPPPPESVSPTVTSSRDSTAAGPSISPMSPLSPSSPDSGSGQNSPYSSSSGISPAPASTLGSSNFASTNYSDRSSGSPQQPVSSLNLNVAPSAQHSPVSPNFAHLGAPPPPPPEDASQPPPSPKPMAEITAPAAAGVTPGGPASAPMNATPGGPAMNRGTPSKIAALLGTSTAPPTPVAPAEPEPKQSKLSVLKNIAKPPPAPVVSPSDPSTWNFDEEDTEANIVFSDDDPEKMHIKGATLCKLVQWLTFEKYRESDFLMSFLLTYRSFTTPFDLVEILKLRYLWVPTSLQGKDEKSPEMEDFRKNRQLPIRIRVVNVFRTWIISLSYDFQGEQGKLLAAKVFEFLDGYVVGTMEKTAVTLKQTLQRKLASGGEEDKSDAGGGPIFSDPPPTPIIPVNVTVLGFMDIHYEEIARQLSLIESDLYASLLVDRYMAPNPLPSSLYKAIKPWECLGQAWTKADKATRAPNLLRFIHRFNQVSKWIAAEIVRVENLRQRVNVLSHAINTAQKCLELHNLNACMAIMSGLQSTAVFRLKQTWAGLPKATMKMFDDIHAIVSSQKSFGKMREVLKTIVAPCIPYLGMYLTDLIFLEDGMPNLLAGTNLINYYKRRKQAEVIMKINQYQQTPFCLEPVSFIQDFLLGVPVPDEEELYNQSLLREEKQAAATPAVAKKEEPKKKEPEKPKPAAAAAPKASTMAAFGKGAAVAAKPPDSDEFGELDLPEAYPFAQADAPSNITFCKDNSIKTATINKLVERMTFEKYTDVAILTAFLMTYRDYATPLEILELLIARYNVPRPRNATPDVLQRFTTVKEVPIHLRIFNFLKNWIEKYWVDFYEDGDLRETFIEFIDNQFSGSMEKAAETLRRNLQKNLEAGPEGFKENNIVPQKPPFAYLPQFLPAEPQMVDFHPEELARQLSLQMFEIYVAIRPREFLSYLRCSSDPIKTYEMAPNIVRLLRFSAQLRMWIMGSILKQRDPAGRAKTITHAIKMLHGVTRALQEKLDEFNNFNCSNEICVALNADHIRKMAKSWDAVSKESITQMDKIRENGNLTRIRTRVVSAQPPCIPWVEPYMGQLQRIHSKRPDQLETGLVNFKKKRELATLILEFQLFQPRQPYFYEPVAVVSDFVRKSLESAPTDEASLIAMAQQYTVEEIQGIHNPDQATPGAAPRPGAAPMSAGDATQKTSKLLSKFKATGGGTAPAAPAGEVRAGAGAAAAVALVTPTHSATGAVAPHGSAYNVPQRYDSSYAFAQSSPHSSGTFTSQQIAGASHTPPTGTPTGTLKRDESPYNTYSSGTNDNTSHGRNSSSPYDSHGRNSPHPTILSEPAPVAPAPIERRSTASLVSSLMSDKDIKNVMRSIMSEEIKGALEKQKSALTQQIRAEAQAQMNEEMEAWKIRVRDHVTLLASRVQIVPENDVQAAASIIISRCFPSGTVTEWKVEDPNGAIFGWPDEENEEQTLVAVLPHVSKSDVSIWLRSYRYARSRDAGTYLCSYYQQCFPTPNLQSAIITPSIAQDAATAASANGIRVLQLVL